MERKKSCLDKHAFIFSVFFCNSFVTSFILTRLYVIGTLQIRIKIILNIFYSIYSVVTRAVVLESGLETFFYHLGLVLDSLVFGLGLVSDLVIGLAKCSSWSRPSPAIYAFFSLSKQRLACSANG